ncbi:hypothetical protein H7R52_05105 [Weissella confusa]|uniref:Uncharacterized protein n=1 Tax=Weissella confusa TaxID=1583 RepID=A0A923NER6_WEICO|nr:hypothetical protein [Weissella confusa]
MSSNDTETTSAAQKQVTGDNQSWLASLMPSIGAAVMGLFAVLFTRRRKQQEDATKPTTSDDQDSATSHEVNELSGMPVTTTTSLSDETQINSAGDNGASTPVAAGQSELETTATINDQDTDGRTVAGAQSQASNQGADSNEDASSVTSNVVSETSVSSDTPESADATTVVASEVIGQGAGSEAEVALVDSGTPSVTPSEAPTEPSNSVATSDANEAPSTSDGETISAAPAESSAGETSNASSLTPEQNDGSRGTSSETSSAPAPVAPSDSETTGQSEAPTTSDNTASNESSASVAPVTPVTPSDSIAPSDTSETSPADTPEQSDGTSDTIAADSYFKQASSAVVVAESQASVAASMKSSIVNSILAAQSSASVAPAETPESSDADSTVAPSVEAVSIAQSYTDQTKSAADAVKSLASVTGNAGLSYLDTVLGNGTTLNTSSAASIARSQMTSATNGAKMVSDADTISFVNSNAKTAQSSATVASSLVTSVKSLLNETGEINSSLAALLDSTAAASLASAVAKANNLASSALSAGNSYAAAGNLSSANSLYDAADKLYSSAENLIKSAGTAQSTADAQLSNAASAAAVGSTLDFGSYSSAISDILSVASSAAKAASSIAANDPSADYQADTAATTSALADRGTSSAASYLSNAESNIVRDKLQTAMQTVTDDNQELANNEKQSVANSSAASSEADSSATQSELDATTKKGASIATELSSLQSGQLTKLANAGVTLSKSDNADDQKLAQKYATDIVALQQLWQMLPNMASLTDNVDNYSTIFQAKSAMDFGQMSSLQKIMTDNPDFVLTMNGGHAAYQAEGGKEIAIVGQVGSAYVAKTAQSLQDEYLSMKPGVEAISSSSLTTLNLANNNISGLGSNSLSHLPNLLNLNLADNKINYLTSGVQNVFYQLQSLNLDNNPLQEELRNFQNLFGVMTGITSLNMSGLMAGVKDMSVITAFMQAVNLPKLTKLTTLDLSDNSGSIDVNSLNLQSTTANGQTLAEVLKVSSPDDYNKVTIGSLKVITKLNLSGNTTLNEWMQKNIGFATYNPGQDTGAGTPTSTVLGVLNYIQASGYKAVITPSAVATHFTNNVAQNGSGLTRSLPLTTPINEVNLPAGLIDALDPGASRRELTG